MLTWLIKWRIAAFERANDCDMGYARDILEADTGAFLKFVKAMGLARYRKGLPRDAWHAATLVATLAEDCGPCTQLAVTLAERDGVAPEVLKAILAGNERAMPEDAALSVRFARATLDRDPAAHELRAQVMRRWGRKGLVSLGFAITAARMYPTLKYALGHGQACRRVTVNGAPVQEMRLGT